MTTQLPSNFPSARRSCARRWRPAIIATLAAIVFSPAGADAETGVALGKTASGAWMMRIARTTGSSDAAKTAALDDCAAHGGVCAHAEAFAQGCLAVAGQKGGQAFGVGRAAEDALARDSALANCAQRAEGCALVASVCDTEHGPAPAGGDLAKALQAWQSCFRPDGAVDAARIAACESAATYGGLGRVESLRLERRRSKLLGADVEPRPNGEKAPSPR